MTFEQFWKILTKQWKLIVICFLLGGVGAFGGSKFMKPVYQSSAFIQVSVSAGSNQASYDNLLASEQLVQTEADLATSTPVLTTVASHYPGLTVSTLISEVSAVPKTNTQLFEITVVDPSPTRVAGLANDVAATLIAQQTQSIQHQNALAQQSLQQNIDEIVKQINQTTLQITTLQGSKGNQEQLPALQAKLVGLQQQYSQWQGALVQLELSQAQSGNIMQVSQPAMPASYPIRPNIPLYSGGGLLAGLLLGILLVLLIEQLDTHIRTPEEITQLLTWPTLATIWRHTTARAENLIGPTGRDLNAETYRILRTNIGFLSVDKPVRSLVITSALPNEGKSTVAANLAIFMARAGKHTLLIDADLRLPVQHTLFNLPSERSGLSNAVLALTPHSRKLQQLDEADTYTLLKPFVHSAGVPNLWVMPSGPLPPNPADFLESQAAQRFLGIVAECGVEIVIIDAPPLVGISDASILASKFDGVLLVVDTMHATREKLKQMKAVLLQSGVHVFGCVANKVQRKHKDAVSYYYAPKSEKIEQTLRSTQLTSEPVISAQAEAPSGSNLSVK